MADKSFLLVEESQERHFKDQTEAKKNGQDVMELFITGKHQHMAEVSTLALLL